MTQLEKLGMTLSGKEQAVSVKFMSDNVKRQ